MMLPAIQESQLKILKRFILFHIYYFFLKGEIFFIFLISVYFLAQTIFPFADIFAVLKWAGLLGFIAIYLIIVGLKNRETGLIQDKLYWALGIFIFYLFINAFLSINILVSGMRTILLLVSFVLWFFILPNYFRRKDEILKLFDYLFYFFAIILILNMVLTLLVPAQFFRIGIYIRYRGITENANTLGMYSMLAVVFSLYKLKTGSKIEKYLSILMLILIAFNFSLTVSRSSILAAFIIILIFTYYFNRKLFYAGIVLSILAAGMLLLFPILLDLLRLASNPLSYRDQLFQIVIEKWKENMIFGLGYGTIQIITSKLFIFFQKGFNLLNIGKHLGNMYLEFLCEAGIIGSVLFLTILVLLYQKQKRLFKRLDGELNIIAVLYKGLFFGFLIQNIFESALLAPGNGVAFLFWSMSGLLLSMEKLSIEPKPNLV